jgi:hypothetical protein
MWYMYVRLAREFVLALMEEIESTLIRSFTMIRVFQNHFTLPVFTGLKELKKYLSSSEVSQNYINNISTLLKQHYPNGGRPEELNEAEYHALHNRCSSVL